MIFQLKRFFSQIFLTCFFICLLSTESFAAHIVGGEIYYDCLGNNLYRVTLKVYKECNSNAPFDNPLSLGVFEGGILVQNNQISLTSSVQIPANSPDPCVSIPPGLCIEEGTYITTLTLDPSTVGYEITYQRCCRNATIANLDQPDTQGATYTIHVNTNGICNSSPRYTNLPPIYLCANTPFTFNHSAIDPNGDVLVYSLCQPNIGGAQSPTNMIAPNPPLSPPYSGVTYLPPYSSSFPIASNPAIAINSSTGQLTLTPTQLGQFVVGICVSEFRNGTLLSTNKRDFQFNVVSCNNVIASIPNQTVFCEGYQVNFTSAGSVNATQFQWDFGVTTLTTDVSTLTNPTYFYPDSGVYNVRLIGISPTGSCRDTSFSTFRVYPLLEPDFALPNHQCLKGNTYTFNAGGDFTTDATFLWNFGQDAVPATSTQKNNSGVTYTTNGTKVVSLTISQYGCTETKTRTFDVFPNPTAQIGNPINNCSGLTIQLENQSTGATNYFWDFGVTFSLSDISTDFQPNITYPDSAEYNVMLVAIDDNNCRDTVFKPTKVYHIAEPDFVIPPQQCVLGNNYSFTGGGNNVYPTSLFTWTFQDANPRNAFIKNPNNIQFNSAGFKDVTFTVNQKGCLSSKTKQVELVSMPTADISDITQYCVGLNVDFINTSSNATSYEWDFGITTLTTDVSNATNPSYLYPDSGKYVVTLVAINRNVCRDTLKELFYVFPLLKAFFNQPADQCIEGNSYDLNAAGTFGIHATFEWRFTDAQPPASTQRDPQNVEFLSPGEKPIQVIYRENGCVKTYTDTAHLFKMPIADFTSPTKICTPFLVQFTDESFAETKLYYEWDFGDGSPIDTSQHPLHLYPDSGFYDVSLTIKTTEGCIDTVTDLRKRYINTEYTPIAGFEVNVIDTLNYRPVFEFIDKSKFATFCSYDLGNGVDTNNCNLQYQYAIDDVYTVTQTVTNAIGCKVILKKEVDAKPDMTIYIPNAFTPNGDGINDAFMAKCSNIITFEMDIFDRWGELVFTTTNSRKGWKGDINESGSDLASQGVYVYKIKVTDVVSSKLYTYTGTVSLIR